MRKILPSVVGVSISIAMCVALVDAQPAPGFSKDYPLNGTGSSGSHLRITPCGTDEVLKSTGTSWTCAAIGGGVTDGDKGDITVTSSGATWTIDPNVVDFSKQADIATARILGRITASTGDPEALTGTQATTLLDAFTTSLKGLAPASGGGTTNYLRADGTWAAPPGAGDITGITSTTPMNINGVGAGSCASGSCAIRLDDGDRGDITLSASGVTWTIDNSTITSAKLNITTTSCSAGQAVTAISAGGVGTCTAVGVSGGTTNYLARWTSSTALGIGQVFDDNTNEVKVGGGADPATRADAEMIVTLNGDTSISVRNSTNDTEFVAVAGGSTVSFGSQTNTNVSLIAAGTAFATYTGSGFAVLDNLSYTGNGTLGNATTNTHTINGSTSLGGGAGINAFSATNANTAQTAGNAAVRGDQTGSYNTTGGALASYAVRGSSTSTRSSGGNNLTNYGVHGTASGAQVNYGVFSDGDLGTTNGNLVDVGTLPTLSSCGTNSRTGGEWSWNITPGAVTACTITFAKACAAAPTCTASPYFSTTAVHFFTSVGTSSAILNITGTGWSGSQVVGVTCICH